MLSDEEKKAIELLKQPPDFSLSYYKRENAIDTILNLIEKQYKEIEELKNITKSYDSFLGDEKIVIADKKFFVNGYFQENFVRKDKIKAEIEELKEDNKKKSIVIIEYQDLYEKLVDKIKAKIEELDYNDIGNFERRCKQEVLKSLLEKE